jgi:dihydrofolate synthase/folylpolyglutamate synthase
LYGLRWYGTKLGLGNTFRLAQLAGDPHQKLRFIHVAGTNGKGSTCAMLESIYRAAGLRVGLFTSPHLVAFGERIQVNRKPIPEEDIVRLVENMRPLLARFSAEEHPTFFEVVTVIALQYFLEQQCDVVIWETGLGGRLDATNIVTPLASVITNIHYDHQKWLGHTLASIASEKAGIIKPGVPAITGATQPEVLEVIRAAAQANNSTLRQVSEAEADREPMCSIQVPLPGRHQRLNAAVALATVDAVQSAIPVEARAIQRGLESVRWAGRLQLERLADGRIVLLDGAHNIGGMEMLARTLQDLKLERPTLILGILQDKDWAPMCRLIAPFAGKIFLVPVHSERTAPPQDLAGPCHEANPGVEVREFGSLKEALEGADEEPVLVITGSLYLIGEALERLGLSPDSPRGERGLNEWKAQPSRA